MKLDGEFVPLRRGLVQHFKGISPRGMTLFLAILLNVNREGPPDKEGYITGYCDKSLGDIQGHLGWSRGTLSNAYNRLKTKGFISRQGYGPLMVPKYKRVVKSNTEKCSKNETNFSKMSKNETFSTPKMSKNETFFGALHYSNKNKSLKEEETLFFLVCKAMSKIYPSATYETPVGRMLLKYPAGLVKAICEDLYDRAVEIKGAGHLVNLIWKRLRARPDAKKPALAEGETAQWRQDLEGGRGAWVIHKERNNA